MSCIHTKTDRQKLARASLIILLVLGIIAPKVTLAAAAAFGLGFESVTICTGGGLKRVTVSPSGEIISPEAAADMLMPGTSGEHCAPSTHVPARNTALEVVLRFQPQIPQPLTQPAVSATSTTHLITACPPRAPPAS